MCREWGEVATFKTAKAERHALQRESMLLVETRSKLAGVRRTRERAGRYEAVGGVVLEEIAYDDELAVHSIGDRGELLPGGVECAEDVGPGLMLIE